MKKIVLVRPEYILDSCGDDISVNIHMGILYIGAVLREAGYSVRLIDALIHKDWRERLNTEAKDALFVGITATTSQVRQGAEAAEIVRKIGKDIPVVWGGVHATILTRQTVENQLCDVAVIGEGEKSSVELAKAFENDLPLDGIEGIAFNREGDFHMNSKSKTITDLDDLPVNIYDFYTDEEMENFIVPTTPRVGSGFKRTFELFCGRGCRFKCTFCINTILPETNQLHRSKSAKRIIEEMELFGERYNIENFWLQDEDFFSDKNKVVEFLDLYEKKGLKYTWLTNTRASYFRDDYMNKEFCDRLTRCGGISFRLGMESGSARILKKIKKGITPETVRNATRILSKTNLEMGYALFIGMPGEERKDIADTIKLMWDISHIAPKNHYFAGPGFYRPYPGTKMFEEAVELGFKTPTSFEEWRNLDLSTIGYITEKELPWIKDNMDIYSYILEVLPILIIDLTSARFYYVMLLLRIILKPIAFIRIKTGFWRLLFEPHFLRFLKKLPFYKTRVVETGRQNQNFHNN